ncbi:MAG: GH25 family lysozyme [Chthoniobacterales bacterium]
MTGIAGLGSFLIWSGLWIPNAPSPTTHPVRGIDISHHQGAIEWSRIDSRQVQFAYIKATEGADYHDPAFLQNWRGADADGLARGAYHFFTLGTPGKAQAENFVAVVPQNAHALPPAVDLEISGYNRSHTQAPADFQRELNDFITVVTARTGKPIVIYTTQDFRRDFLAGGQIDLLWIREVMWRPSGSWMFWQFTPRGRVPGIRGFVDLNVFAGSKEEFARLVAQ